MEPCLLLSRSHGWVSRKLLVLEDASFTHQPGSWPATDATLKKMVGDGLMKKIIDKGTGRSKSTTQGGKAG